ncbi:multidrug ABC transporter ATPase [Kocuria dechangensis]|uniref:Multidrug ABC transporter ATPase n=1 Tax=Kocuria dechangensis TaxID=1176249 RepID=A0A917GWG1_9MICC|nr:ABC transporter ATP-binding protein [Kocuria dechangensis]GGG59358.1 multidrug ABC transporter ATPase [Kocuria dechangensis]
MDGPDGSAGAAGGPPRVLLHEVSKRYGPVSAVDSVSLSIGAGEVYALLGLNGAGKTTLLRLLLGMVRPSGGTAALLGRPVGDRRTWARVGYLVETPSAYPELTVRENLEVVRYLRRLPDRTAVDDAVERFGLTAYADRRARALSLGNLQRLGLAKALLHRPELVVLDEPVNGLDPAGVAEIRALLAGLAREHGATVLLSSHLLGEVARIATRIGVLHEGRLVEELDAAALARRVHRHVRVTTRDDARAADALTRAGLAPRRVPGAVLLEDAWSRDRPDAVATVLVRSGVPPTGLAVVQEDLESHFLRVVGADPAGSPGDR